MPYVIEIDPAAARTRIRCEGASTVADFMAHLEELAALFDRPSAHLVDLRGQTTAFDADVMRQGAAWMSVHSGDRGPDRIAYLADAGVVFGMLRVYGAHREQSGVLVRVFREEAEALAWLRSDRLD